MTSIGIAPSRQRASAAATLGLLMAFGAASQAHAVTLTDLALVSNSGSFINNTIVDGTSPLAFTQQALGAAFLNAGDSTILLGYGVYYAYAFSGFGQHAGSGSLSGKRDGVSFSTAVTFPSDLSVPGTFLTFNFLDGETISLATTGLVADRIRIVADGGGLFPDGNTDAVYSFSYGAAVPEPAALVLMLVGLSVLATRARQRS